jgi:hypothetical protein
LLLVDVADKDHERYKERRVNMALPRFNAARALALILIFTAILEAQRTDVGAGFDVVSGLTNNPGGTGGGNAQQLPSSLDAFYAVYPTITLTSLRGRSTLTAAYTFGLNKTEGDQSFKSESHSASVTFSRPVGARWNTSVTETYLVTSDASTFNTLRGVTPPVENVRFLFDPVAVRQSSRTNRAGITASYLRNPQSNIAFSASHDLRNYDTNRFTGALSDQQGFTGSIVYTHLPTSRESWNFQYSGTYFDFQDFNDSTVHTITAGYSVDLGRNLKTQLRVGMATVQSVGVSSRYTGYNTAVRLEKATPATTFSVSYDQESGQPSGLGSTSNIRRIGVGMGRKVGQGAFTLDASVFDSQGTLDNTLDTRGFSASAGIGFPVNQRLSIQGGGQFQRYDQTTALFAFTQKRLFVSIRYNYADLWRVFQ